jgi:hypothetical protein
MGDSKEVVKVEDSKKVKQAIGCLKAAYGTFQTMDKQEKDRFRQAIDEIWKD